MMWGRGGMVDAPSGPRQGFGWPNGGFDSRSETFGWRCRFESCRPLFIEAEDKP